MLALAPAACSGERESLQAAQEREAEAGHDHDDEAPGEPVTPTGPPVSVAADTAPTVRGTFGQKPVVTIPDGPPPGALARRVLREGDGRVVTPGDVILAHHYGVTWSDKRVFENSYVVSGEPGRPVGFSIGMGNVIAGWDEGLVGVPAGSRVLLIVPPDKAYGEEGHPDAEVSPSETLVYVVDVLGAHAPNAVAEGTPASSPAGLPTVGRGEDGYPEVRVPAGVAPPPDLRKALLVRGDGARVRPGALLAVQYTGATWRDSHTFTSTWERGSPVPVQVGEDPFRGEVAKALVGVPVGSRVLITVPPKDGYGEEGLPEAGVRPDDTIVYLVDVLGQYGTFDVSTAPPVDDHDHGEGEGEGEEGH